MNEQFIEFLATSGAIKFGVFTLKSGRQSPFFISTGVLCDGLSSYELGKAYAAKINEKFGAGGSGSAGGRSKSGAGTDFDIIFGPAYKGIPLAVSVSIALQKEFGINKPWLFDRKEKKIHGDAGVFVGCELDKDSRVVLVDDVMTTGETKFEAIDKIKSYGANVVGIVIAVDRMEKGIRLNAIEEFTNKCGVPVYPITNVKEIFDYLRNRSVGGKVYVNDSIYRSFIKYREKYGV